MASEFNHFDKAGNAVMVDVSGKNITERVACAEGSILVGKEIFRKIKEGSIGKGDVLGVARIAGIMATKRTGDLIPLCHPLMLEKVSVDFELQEENWSVKAVCTVKTSGRTGVEMEALTGVSTALLTIYDMCKAVSKTMEITQIHLVSKSGGKSGDYTRVGAVITAAGMSTRMKEFKQLMPVVGRSMAENVISRFREAGIEEIVVVTGYRAEEVEAALKPLGVKYVRNENYAKTQMFDSAKIGLNALKDSCNRILFCPVDIPLFSVETVKSILTVQGEVVIPILAKKRGHPIAIESSLVPLILAYDGEGGLKGALDHLPVKPVFVPTCDQGTVTDADTQEDYVRLCSMAEY